MTIKSNEFTTFLHTKKILCSPLYITMITIAFGVSGCNHDKDQSTNKLTTDGELSELAIPAQKSEQDNNQVITLTSEDILSTKPELYQPSYNLYGQLVPVTNKQILALDNAYISEIFVNNGDWVSPNQPLIKLRLDFSNNSTTSNSTTSNSIASESTTSNLATHNMTASVDNQSANGTINLDDNSKKEPHKNQSNKPNDRSDTISTEIAAGQPIHNNDGDDSRSHDTSKDVQNSIQDQNYITLTSPSEGEVTHISVKPNDKVQKNQLLLTLADTTHLQLIGELPLVSRVPDGLDGEDMPVDTESQLSIGQAVNFTVHDVHQEFSGQISHTYPSVDGDMLTVRALVNQTDDTKTKLDEGMQATMSFEYGQAKVGIRMPRRGIHDVDLSGLSEKHTRPVLPLYGYVWVIGQDLRLSRERVNVVEFFPQTDQFLVTGISNDSLISLVDLPADKEGSLVKLE